MSSVVDTKLPCNGHTCPKCGKCSAWYTRDRDDRRTNYRDDYGDDWE
ncbi:unnamed protein product, partial [Rotaria sp. Silwood2]